MTEFQIVAKLWRWEMAAKNGSWIFLTIVDPVASHISAAARAGPWLVRRRGFGSVKVQVDLGQARWLTSLFPQNGGDAWLLPVKAVVRRAEGVGEGDEVAVTIRLWEE